MYLLIFTFILFQFYLEYFCYIIFIAYFILYYIIFIVYFCTIIYITPTADFSIVVDLNLNSVLTMCFNRVYINPIIKFKFKLLLKNQF